MESKDSIEVEDRYKDKIDSVAPKNGGKPSRDEEKDEKIKKRLEDLGYM